MKIRINIIIVEIHHSIKMIKRYHEFLRRVYAIIVAKMLDIDFNSILQIIFKTLNDLINFDELIFTLLAFDAYFRIIEMNVSSSTIIQQFIAMRKAMKEVRKFVAIHQLNDALNTWNDSFIILIHNLSLNFSVLVFREKNNDQSESWKDSFKLLNVNDESVILKLSNDSTKFRSTMIKSYYDNNHDLENSSSIIIDSLFTTFFSKSSNISQSNVQFTVSIDQNSEFKTFSNSFKRDRDRLRKYFAFIAYLSFVFNMTNDLDLAFVFASTSIFVFAVVFKFDSIAHIALSQFAAFRQKEINDLIEKNVFQSVNKDDVLSDVRIFNFRFVDEIKHFDINKAFEKSPLVMQTFNDQNKNLILIQSFIIQRINQRLIVCLIVVFSKMNLYLKNIMQTYVQSVTSLNRDFFVCSFVELIKHLDIDTNSILKIAKSLYDVFEIDNH
jgi:hypothetical protein